ncbi:MAG: response regulator [Acidimicrobiia bacterium]|nr:response regulator [Acidimicrobiia bacterium]
MKSESYYSSALYDVARSINSSLDLSQVLDLLAKSTAKATKSKACSLRLLNADKSLLVMGGAYGLSQGYLRKGNVEVEKSRIDQEALLGKTGIIPDATNDPRFQYPDEAKAESIRSILVIPLMLRDNPVGVMRLYTEDVHEFSDAEIGFVRAIANLGAIAIENAKLFEALKEELGDLTEDANEMAERLHESRTQLARQMNALSYEKNRLETILASMGEGVIVTDLDHRILLVNAAAEGMLDIHRQDAIGKDCGTTLPVKKTELEQILQAASDAKPSPPLVKKFRNKVLSILVSQIRDEKGQPFGLVSVFRDITQQAAIEALKSEFISVVSHELRTPLTPIKGYIDLILEGDAGELTEEQKAYLKIVEMNTDRLVALVNDLLDISRIEAGKIDLELKPVAVEDVIQETVAVHRKQIESRGLSLTLAIPSRLPWVKADRNRIAQVLNNLVSNACKYTPSGGISIAAAPDGEFLEVAVSDTGVGLSRDDMKKLFTKFFRAKNPATSETAGTGLGLAITKSIVEKHGGEIWVESRPGKGAAFHFTLPLVEPLPVVRRPRTALRRSTKTILVVDDEKDIARMIRRQLERAGYRVRLAHSGEEAVAQAVKHRPDLISMDIQMPGMNGIEVIENLRANPKTADLPIVVVSVAQDEEQLSKLGVTDILDKPIDEDSFLQVVERILWEGQRILIYASEPEARQVLEEVLSQRGYQLIFASDGLDLLVHARKEQPDLILMDLEPPDMDGYEVLRRLNRRPETVDIPVIAMTASSTESVSKVLAVGGNDLVRKPLDLEALVVEIERFIKGVTEKR